MDCKDIKAFVFDLDYTLYDEMQFFNAGMKAVSEYVSEKYHIPAKEVYEFCIESVKKEGRGKTYDHLCEEYHFDADPMTLVEVYRAARPKLHLYDEAAEVLKRLKNEGKLIGVITDGNAAVQEAKVRLLGLFDFIDALVLPDSLVINGETHFTKPNPVVYEACIEKLGVKPEEAVYIGDNPAKDFWGAKKIGMKTILIIREEGLFMRKEAPSKEFEADESVKDLRDIFKER
ncbi:MAG: HAD family hydrolase [Lachnospiraceae bacterium]|nr:HAD family hydrolase [Lachnospiraceae bacterium]